MRCLPGDAHTRERVWSVQDLGCDGRESASVRKSVPAETKRREWVEGGPVGVGEGQRRDMTSDHNETNFN